MESDEMSSGRSPVSTLRGAPAPGQRPLSGLAPDGGEAVTWLAEEVARLARVAPSRIDPRKPIASYGLDSLAAIELMHAIETRTGVSIAMETLFSEVTVADLAASLANGPGEPAADGGADVSAAAPPVPATAAAAAPRAGGAGSAAGDFRLSRAQLSLWFLHALAPASPAYNVPNAVRVRGELDVVSLLGAFRILVDRHPALRTTFVAVAGEPLQRVAARGELQVTAHDAASWSEDELIAHLAAESALPFDLERGPLVRLGLYTLSAGEHVLLLSLHHIVTDFWSLGVMLDELAALYAALRQGRSPRLPAAPPAYAELALRQERELAGAAGEALWEHWRERLAGGLPVLDLPSDRPRPRVQTTAGGVCRRSLAEPLAGGVRRLARLAGATPFVVLLAAFEALLHRYSGQSDLLLGTVAAARTRAAFARTVGYFVNPLVLRADLAGDPGFAELVARARREALGAFDHQDYPFPLLVERLQPPRDPSRSPLFQVMFVLQKAQLADGQDLTGFALGEPGARVDLGGLALETIPLEQGIAQFDLTLTMGEAGGRLIASFDYNRDLFDAATVARLAGHFERLLAAALADPGRAVSELPLLDAAEERQLIEAGNDTRVPYRDGASIAELFAEQAAATPGAVAAVFAGRELTYGELARRAGRLARRLRRLGVGPEVLVGVCVERSFDVLIAALGVLEAGGAYLPIDPEYPRDRIAHLLASAGTNLVLTHETLRPLVSQGAAGPRLLCLDAEAEAISAGGAGAPPERPPQRPPEWSSESPPETAAETQPEPEPAAVRPDAANLACAIFTSGSTGQPKGVLLEHRNLVNMVASFVRSYRPAPADRILPLTSIAYASFVGEVLPLLCSGGAVVLPQKHELLDVAALVSLIVNHQVSMVSTVPSMLAGLDALGDRLPRLRLLLVGGEALPAADVAGLLARPGAPRIVNGYGLTETTICSTIHTVGPADLAAGVQPPIGKPLMNQRVYVLDRHLRPLPLGCAGELFVAGDGLARGYLGQPDQTAARFLPDPFAAGGRVYRTGDLAARRADGNLVFLGRGDQQVKLRGFRIELAEIEAALALHPRVQAAAALVRRDGGDREPRLIGYVVPRPAPGETLGPAPVAAPSAGELLAWLRARLPDYMVPASLVFLAALPRNPNGKIDAARLPLPERIRPELAAAYAAPRSELERAIAGVWREALKVASVGLDDSFFDLGGHSLLMAKVHARLGEALGREVSLLELFQYPTVGSLARHLAGAGAQRSVQGQGAGAQRGVAGSGGSPGDGAGSSGSAEGFEARERGGRRRVAERAAGAGAETEIAVIGMAGRFPGAPDVRRLWLDLVAGREGISFFSAEELIAAGIDRALVERPDYVKAKGYLGGVELFDAAFFGLNPREVELMDPQHRLFLECAWEALEDAGWDAERFPGLIGVYAGESMNTYLLMNLLSHLELVASADTLQASLGNDKDPLTARVSYKLNLKGPSITIQSASSTSLVAVHSACQALANRDCDMAIAGGVSIHLPEKSGYLYQEGGTVASDGHTRAFDAGSTGFVSGNGCGVVVLKRLSEALADRDHVYAVIKGTACNNDGSHKVSFMAPSVDGQVQLYELAYANAGVDPDTVSYVECHGTGTAIGDPIEIGALTQAFAAHTRRKGFCAIGSLKTNIGHLDTAAGVCGLIKAALALHHRTLPPSLHFRTPNPRIDFANSPFYVNAELRPWEVAGGGPRRAGVTSLGMGGTNAHVVLEEAPAASLAPARAPRPWQLMVLSAKTAKALDHATLRLADQLREQPELEAADVAYTLQVGRKAFQHRRALLCRDLQQAAAALETLDPERLLTAAASPGEHPVAFLFPGQGAQYLDMGRGLYESEAAFRDAVDRCCDLLPFDLRGAMFGAGGAPAAAAERLQRTEVAQPALFVISWATARLWLSWGVRPAALLGHSIGEYVAACLAGVFSLEDALSLVVERGRLMQQMAPGAMLAVPLPEAEVVERIGRRPLSLATVNRPDLCVVSGSPADVDGLGADLEERGVAARRLHTSHAFHSHTADPILAPFTDAVRRVRLAPPGIPLVSNLTGTWMRPEEATDPTYWARQLRCTVRFGDGLARLLAEPQRILLEVGPGDTLSTAAREHPARQPSQAVIASLRHPKAVDEDAAVLLGAVARLWLAGGDFDWEAFGASEQRRRLSLPTYPFERQRYWVDPLPQQQGASRSTPGSRRDPGDWTYVPVWKQAPLPRTRAAGSAGAFRPAGSAGMAAGSGAGRGEPSGECRTSTLDVRRPASHPGEPAMAAGSGAGAGELWLLLADRATGEDAAADCGALLAERLAAAGKRVVRAFAGERFTRLDAATYTLAPGSAGDYGELLAAAAAGHGGHPPTHIVHLWSLAATSGDAAGLGAPGAAPGTATAGRADRAALDRSFYSLLFLGQAIGKRNLTAPISLLVVTAGLHEVTGEERLAPLQATALGPCGAIPREYPNVTCRALDLLPPADAGAAALAVDQILAEAAREAVEPRVAFRRGRRFVQAFEPLPLAPRPADAPPRLRPQGVCLITGGLGGIGLELAEHLARQSGARLVLVGRTPLPEREAWQPWLAADGEAADDEAVAAGERDRVSRKLRRLLELERLGAEVLALSADVADPSAAAAVVAAAERRFGAVHAVIHAAGVPGGGFIQGKTREAAARVLAPKIDGALALAAALAGRPLDFFVLASSTTAVLAQAGQVDYIAANAFLDAFAADLARRGVPAVAIAWDAWRETGMAVATEVPEELRAWRQQNLERGLTSREGVELFERAVESRLSQVLISTLPFDLRREQNDHLGALADLERLAGLGEAEQAAAGEAHPRPALANPYVAPQSESELQIAAVWREVLGVEPVGLHDNFFELGGNSLAGLRVVQRLRERLGAGLSEVSLYEAPTVGALARMIAAPSAGLEKESPAGGVAPAEQESRQRGERRKARLAGRSAAGGGAGGPDAFRRRQGERTT
jgi:amino acid adenylation domain-containing protein